MRYCKQTNEGLHNLFHTKINIGSEEYGAAAKMGNLAVQKASYKALVNTMYAFKELPHELINVGSTEEGGMYEIDEPKFGGMGGWSSKLPVLPQSSSISP